MPSYDGGQHGLNGDTDFTYKSEALYMIQNGNIAYFGVSGYQSWLKTNKKISTRGTCK